MLTKRWSRYPGGSHRCPRCRVEKPFEAFYRDKSKSTGRRFICKECDLEKSRRYYRENRERKLAQANARNAAKRARRQAA